MVTIFRIIEKYQIIPFYRITVSFVFSHKVQLDKLCVKAMQLIYSIKLRLTFIDVLSVTVWCYFKSNKLYNYIIRQKLYFCMPYTSVNESPHYKISIVALIKRIWDIGQSVCLRNIQLKFRKQYFWQVLCAVWLHQETTASRRADRDKKVAISRIRLIRTEIRILSTCDNNLRVSSLPLSTKSG